MDWNPKSAAAAAAAVAAAAVWDWPDSPAFAATDSPSASIDSSTYAAGPLPPPPPSLQDPPLGLKLGKRTYFEDVSAGAAAGSSNPVSSSSASSFRSAAASKRSRVSSSSQPALLRCQVQGCDAELTGAKDYHRKHRVCESHSKSSLVVVAGQQRRFCQQCSRFHDPAAFDEKKRSCRKRLADHNARRRKPQQATISFDSKGISLPCYDDRHHTNFLFRRAPFGQLKPSTSSTWKDSCDFSISHVKGSWLESPKGNVGGELLPATDLPNPFSTSSHDLDRLVPFKLTNSEVLTQGSQASVAASNLNGAPYLRRAFSLLSSDSWGSAEPGPSSLNQQVPANQTNAAQHAIRYNQNEQPLAQQQRELFAMHSDSSQFQELQLLKSSYAGTFFDSSQIH